MKVVVHAGALADVTRRAALAADDKSPLAPLSAARLTAADGKLTVYSTNLHRGVSASVACEIEAPGAAAPRAVALRALAEGLPPDAQVEIESDDAALTLRAGRGRYRFPLIPVKDMPQPLAAGQNAACIDIDAGELAKLLRVAFAAAEEKTRFHLRSIYLHSVSRALVAVAVNGHRLARVVSSIEAESMPGVIVPIETVELLNKLIKGVEGRLVVCVSPKVIEVCGDNFSLASKLVDGTFPDYARAIPRDPRNCATVDRAALAVALERLEAIVPRGVKSPAVVFTWNGEILRLYGPDGEEEIAAEAVEGSAETAFSFQYARDFVKQHAGQRMRLAATGEPGASIVITNPDDATTLIVQAPVRVPPRPHY